MNLISSKADNYYQVLLDPITIKIGIIPNRGAAFMKKVKNPHNSDLPYLKNTRLTPA
jgi:hypothetical protein